MPAHEPSDDDDQDGRDAVVTVETGRAGQRLVCEGWLASHADSGTPGPHVHLRTSDGEPPVLRTDQLPVFVAALTTVAERVDRLWETEGDEYAAEVVLRSPDPQDPRVARERAQDRLRFTQAVLDNLADVMRLLTEAPSTDEALVAVATLLGTDEAEVATCSTLIVAHRLDAPRRSTGASSGWLLSARTWAITWPATSTTTLSTRARPGGTTRRPPPRT